MFNYRTGTVLHNDLCSNLFLSLKGDLLKAKGEYQALHLCSYILHLGMVVISEGRQPLSSNSASQNGKPSRGFWGLVEHITALVLCTSKSFPKHVHMSVLMAAYQGVSRVRALGGSSREGGTLQSRAALRLWHGRPLQTWGRANALSLPLEGRLSFLFCFELGLLWGPLRSGCLSPEDFKALGLPPVAGSSSTLSGATCC